MKDILWIAVAAAVLALMVSGCTKSSQGKYTPEQMKTIPFPQKYDLPQPTGGITLNVDSETLTTKELVMLLEPQLKPLAQQGNFMAFKQSARPIFRSAMRSRVTDVLLYKEARKKAPETIDDALDKAVESELNRFLVSYDNNRALADNALRSMGYDWKSFRDFQRKLILTQSYLSQEFTDKRPISHSEIAEYYNQHKEMFSWDGKIQFRLIDIIAEKLPDELVGESETRETAAVRLAVEILDKLKAGEDFGALAEKYSQGSKADEGGLMPPITIGGGSLPAPYETLEQKAITMDPSEVAGPLVSEGHLMIVKLESRQEAGCKEFKDVQNAIEQNLQIQYRKLQYDKMVDKLMAQADILKTEQFVDQCVIDAYALWSESK
jgi:parvulin-like peptidyl-prolyl isomerase